LIRRELLLPLRIALANLVFHGDPSALCENVAVLFQYQIQRTGLTLRRQPAIVESAIACSKSAMAEVPEKQYPQKRRSRRAKIARTLWVRPSEPRDEHFEDMPISINASREGIFFSTRKETYYPGMRVFVTFPYSSPHDPMNCEYVAQVVRVEKLPNAKYGVALNLLLTVNYSAAAPRGSVTRA
jgi:hypothetical protein